MDLLGFSTWKTYIISIIIEIHFNLTIPLMYNKPQATTSTIVSMYFYVSYDYMYYKNISPLCFGSVPIVSSSNELSFINFIVVT